jgi:hypothetical protein
MDDRADLIIRGESIVAFTELANMLKGEKQ